MTSDPAFVWVWLPGALEPVVGGRLDAVGDELRFTYGASYLKRSDAIPLEPETLALDAHTQRPPVGLDAHGVIRDAAPDAWGMRAILRRLAGKAADDTSALPLLTYLLEAGSNRIGALDVTRSPTEWTERVTQGTLTELFEASERLVSGRPLTQELHDALRYGTSVGGARPKALISEPGINGGPEMIAKFGVSTDAFPWVEAEAVGMELARRCGVDAASTRLVEVAGRRTLLVDRFDRPGDGSRRSVLSGLTLLGLHELAARHASYTELADLVRRRFADPTATLHQLFLRVVVNILVGNTDDHARNIAAFWDGARLQLTPAYDVCPQPRSTGEAHQAMAYGQGLKRSRLADCVDAAAIYQLSRQEATGIVDRCSAVVTEQFDEVCDTVGVGRQTAEVLWEHAVANPSIFYTNT